MRRLLSALALIAAIALVGGLWLTSAERSTPEVFAGLQPDPARGEWVFNAAGCASCHAAPKAEEEDKLILAGGEGFASDFGTFFAPNISPSAAGISGWEAIDLYNALVNGTSPSGQHYYPALPYPAYRQMTAGDVLSLHAYMQTLPPSDVASIPHDVGFPFSIRRSLGGWKLLFLKDGFTITDPADDQVAHGRYLVEALGHCAECHTPRGALGQLDRSRWLEGAPNPAGRGTIPGLTVSKLGWSGEDIAYFLETGLTPDFDSTGAQMADVVRNFAKLTPQDREAVAAYLLSLP